MDNISKQRIFFRHTALIFLEIRQVFLRQIALSAGKSPPTGIVCLRIQVLTLYVEGMNHYFLPGFSLAFYILICYDDIRYVIQKFPLFLLGSSFSRPAQAALDVL